MLGGVGVSSEARATVGVAAVYRSSGELGQGFSCSSAVGVWNLAGTGRAIACPTLAIAVGAAGVHGG